MSQKHAIPFEPEEDDQRSQFRGGTTSREVVLGRIKFYSAGKAKAASSGAVAKAEKRFAVLRVGKIKTLGHLSAAADHLSRNRETLNADQSRLSDNEQLVGHGGAEDVLQAWRDQAPEKIRKNAVHALEYVITASPDAMKAMSIEDQSDYFEDALAFIEARHGSENVLTAVVHRDEMTPHLQALVIPIDERGKLNAREFIGGKQNLRRMQTDFAEVVADRFGLERGLERSQAKHQTIKQYYAKAEKRPDLDFSLPERDKGFLGKEGAERYLGRVTDAVRASWGDAMAYYEQKLETAQGEAHSMAGQLERLEDLETENATLRRSATVLQEIARAARSLGTLGQLDAEHRRLTHQDGLEMLQTCVQDIDIYDTESDQSHTLGGLISSAVMQTLTPTEIEELDDGNYKVLSKAIKDPVDQINVARQYLSTAAKERDDPALKFLADDLKSERITLLTMQSMEETRRLKLEMGISLDDDFADDMGL